MKDRKIKQPWSILYQRNIIFTVLVFFIGFTLQLADTTLILLVLGVAILSTWWQWHPRASNTESKLILDTLTNYPAVTIKNQSHIIAFNSNPPCLAAAYSISVPSNFLRRYMNSINLTEGVEMIVSHTGLDSFLLLKTQLTPYTCPKNALRTFQCIIDLLELQFQSKFNPAERYQTLRLFGLEKYLQTSDSSPRKSLNLINSYISLQS
ncbi:MAG: hypothetical protein ACFFBD_06835 [Candidatus Hodarchaeota archaeon]